MIDHHLLDIRRIHITNDGNYVQIVNEKSSDIKIFKLEKLEKIITI